MVTHISNHHSLIFIWNMFSHLQWHHPVSLGKFQWKCQVTVVNKAFCVFINIPSPVLWVPLQIWALWLNRMLKLTNTSPKIVDRCNIFIVNERQELTCYPADAGLWFWGICKSILVPLDAAFSAWFQATAATIENVCGRFGAELFRC